MIDFLKQKDSQKWFVYAAGKVIAICEVNNYFPIVSFTKDAIGLLPSTVSMVAKGVEILKQRDCGEYCKITLACGKELVEKTEVQNQLALVEIDRSFSLKTTDEGIRGKGVRPLSTEDYWKPV
jgi:hypothetical protein